MTKVAYSGIEGAFAHAAARKMYPYALHMPYGNFRKTYDAVINKECDMAVLPVENSYAGNVKEVTSLLSEHKVLVIANCSLPIVQNLLGMRGSRLNDIKKVISHQKALEQCDEYIKEKGYVIEEAVNTAVAAKQVADMQNLSVAAIGSLEVAALYGLKVLEEHINVKNDNTTKFVAISLYKNR